MLELSDTCAVYC